MVHPVDVHVGMRVRQRRRALRMTQQQLGHKVGVKFQQIQKYETGANRISASRLWDIAEALEVDVRWFFEGLKKNEPIEKSAVPGDLLSDREALKLAEFYHAMTNAQRKNLLNLVRSMGSVE